MASIYAELALYGSQNECARTETVFSPISEVCDGTVSLMISQLNHNDGHIWIPLLNHSTISTIGDIDCATPRRFNLPLTQNPFHVLERIHSNTWCLDTTFSNWPQAARWRYRLFIKNLTAHYNSQFCVSFLPGTLKTPLDMCKWGLKIIFLFQTCILVSLHTELV